MIMVKFLNNSSNNKIFHNISNFNINNNMNNNNNSSIYRNNKANNNIDFKNKIIKKMGYQIKMMMID